MQKEVVFIIYTWWDSIFNSRLFIWNNYLPIIVCLIFIVVSIVLSFEFEDIYKDEKKKSVHSFKEYKNDLKTSFKFIFNSKRMKAFVLFKIAFGSLIYIVSTYRSELLVNMGIPEEQFSIIFAVLTLIGGISLLLKQPIEKIFKNRTLTFLSLTYIGTCIIIGTISNLFKKALII